MKAEGRSLNFLNDEDLLEIPFFQRPYVWEKENWKDLLDDLLRTDGNHFLGSIIIKHLSKSGRKDAYGKIIDGQQRLTTLTILIKVMYEILYSANKLEGEMTDFTKDCLFYYSKAEKKYIPHISHSHLDKDKYEAIIGVVEVDSKTKAFKNISSPMRDDILNEIKQEVENNKALKKEGKVEKDIFIDSKNLLRSCYKFFYYELTTNVKISKIQKLFNSLFDEENNILVVIDIDEKEQEQEIFDTINSAGMSLTSTDIIKNCIYERLKQLKMSEKDLLKYYEETWQQTFEDNEQIRDWWCEKKSIGRCKRDNTEILLQSVGIIRGIFDVENETIADLAKAYKRNVASLKDIESVQKLISEIITYAKIFKEIPTFDPKTLLSFGDVKSRLSCIVSVSENTTFTPYILYLYEKYSQNQEKLEERLSMVEKILMHYLLTGKSNKNFNKYCYQLVLYERDKTETELMQYIKNEPDNFTDADLREGIKYVKSNKLAKLFLYWIELYRRSKLDAKDDGYNEPLAFKKEMELEHILPQKWYTDNDWIKQIIVDASGNEIIDVKEAEQYRTRMVYSLGNMTLLKKGLNSSISNSIFRKKVDGEKGKNNGIRAYVKLSISKEIIDKNPDLIWNEQKIAEREKLFANEIIEIWGCK